MTKTILASALALLLLAPATAPAATKDCGDVAFAPQSDWGAFDVRARGTSCRTARRVARASRDLDVVRGPFHYRWRGFGCRGVAEDEGLPTVDWTCRRDGARVTFTRS